MKKGVSAFLIKAQGSDKTPVDISKSLGKCRKRSTKGKLVYIRLFPPAYSLCVVPDSLKCSDWVSLTKISTMEEDDLEEIRNLSSTPSPSSSLCNEGSKIVKRSVYWVHAVLADSVCVVCGWIFPSLSFSGNSPYS